MPFLDHAAFQIFDTAHYDKCVWINFIYFKLKFGEFKPCDDGIYNICVVQVLPSFTISFFPLVNSYSPFLFLIIVSLISSLTVDMIVTPMYSSTPSTTKSTVFDAVRYVRNAYKTVSIESR